MEIFHGKVSFRSFSQAEPSFVSSIRIFSVELCRFFLVKSGVFLSFCLAKNNAQYRLLETNELTLLAALDHQIPYPDGQAKMVVDDMIGADI